MMFLKGTRGVLPVKGTKGRKGRVKKQRRPQRRDDDCRQPWRMRTDKGWPAHCGMISNIFTICYFTIFIFIKKWRRPIRGDQKQFPLLTQKSLIKSTYNYSVFKNFSTKKQNNEILLWQRALCPILQFDQFLIFFASFFWHEHLDILDTWTGPLRVDMLLPPGIRSTGNT